jgi:hypothetical protein
MFFFLTDEEDPPNCDNKLRIQNIIEIISDWCCTRTQLQHYAYIVLGFVVVFIEITQSCYFWLFFFNAGRRIKNSKLVRTYPATIQNVNKNTDVNLKKKKRATRAKFELPCSNGRYIIDQSSDIWTNSYRTDSHHIFPAAFDFEFFFWIIVSIPKKILQRLCI